jgi:hypothetical protein
MAALYGRMQGNRGEATRMGTSTSGMRAQLETWEGQITVTLEADGSFQVFIGPKGSARDLVLLGNVNDGQRYAIACKDHQAVPL